MITEAPPDRNTTHDCKDQSVRFLPMLFLASLLRPHSMAVVDTAQPPSGSNLCWLVVVGRELWFPPRWGESTQPKRLSRSDKTTSFLSVFPKHFLNPCPWFEKAKKESRLRRANVYLNLLTKRCQIIISILKYLNLQSSDFLKNPKQREQRFMSFSFHPAAAPFLSYSY